MARQDYTLTVFDADGDERHDENGDLGSAKAAARMRSESITDIFIMSHGWNGDVPAALRQFNGWTDALMACPDDLAHLRASRPGFKPLLVGFHWPSLPWGDENVVESFDINPAAAVDPVAGIIDRLGGTPAIAGAVHRLFAEVAASPDMKTITPGLNRAYEDLDAALNLGASGVGGPPGDDREPFNPQHVLNALSNQPQSFDGFDFSGLLTPLRVLSFWCMKARARKLGETAAAGLVESLQAAGPADVRVHLMGHSFGCIVVTSTASVSKHPITSMVLVQGAMSLWSFAKLVPNVSTPGYFHPTCTKVSGPIVTTQSQFDTAVRTLYPIAAGVAFQQDYASIGFPVYGGVGTFGIQGLDRVNAVEAMLGVKEQYGFQGGQIYNVRSDNVICTGKGMVGAHSDLMHPEVGHLVWQAALALEATASVP